MLLYRFNFKRHTRLLERTSFYFNLRAPHLKDIMSYKQQMYLNTKVCSFFQKRFFFFLPSLYFDGVGLTKNKQIKERKAHFRMKPGYQVLMRKFRSQLLGIIQLRFYRHKRITN